MSRIPAAYGVDLGYPLYLLMRIRPVCHKNAHRIGKIRVSKASPNPRQGNHRVGSFRNRREKNEIRPPDQ